ncbi:MAG: hypothetical protein Q8P57_04195 [Candidatus Pacearchaeota archaeon]|nr:hypothetical protein [Candidatus Pacearchaeota archaeon]
MENLPRKKREGALGFLHPKNLLKKALRVILQWFQEKEFIRIKNSQKLLKN